MGFMYATIRHNSGGYHGHQIKDHLGGITIMHLLGMKYLHTPYTYLEEFGFGDDVPRMRWWRRYLGFRRAVRIKGPLWDGFSDFRDFQKTIASGIGHTDDKTLYILEKAVRVHPFQTIPWFKEGLIGSDIFTAISRSTSAAYRRRHSIPDWDMPGNAHPVDVAIHISRGVDYDPNRFPEHFDNSRNVRYMFLLCYFDRVMSQIEEAVGGGYVRFHVYTEALHSGEIVDHFSSRSNVEVNVGNNRREKNDQLIHRIFRHFVTADILVTCNSSFSTVATYFRDDRPTIYHPHEHLDHLNDPLHIPTMENGEFDIELLKSGLGI